MATVLNRVTKELIESANTPDYPVEDWIINPDLSAVDGFDRKYWKVDQNRVVLASELERAAIDEAEAAAAKESEVNQITDEQEVLGAIIKRLIDENAATAKLVNDLKTAITGAVSISALRAAVGAVTVPATKTIDQIRDELKGIKR